MSLEKIHGSSRRCASSGIAGRLSGGVHPARERTKCARSGMPTWSDKLLQEVMRRMLEAYYEPQFSDRSHGFRPGRGCHTALREIYRHWRGTVWFIEGDIRGCFDNIDHEVLMSILREKVLDHRFVRLIENLLKAGYLEEWRYHDTLSGTPQGGIVSPILANIYLDRLDTFVESTAPPDVQHEETIGKPNMDYRESARPRRLPEEHGPHGGGSRPASAGADSFLRACSTTQITVVSGTSGTPTTSCSDSSEPVTKPRRSSSNLSGLL